MTEIRQNRKVTTFTFPCFTQDQVKEINKKIKENILQVQDPADTAINASKKGDFFNVPCAPLMGLIHPFIYQCQAQNRFLYGYDIYWDFHLDILNYNVYKPSGEYGWHIDANDENISLDRKLTCLLNLSEESYEGGEFKLTGVDEKIKFDSGMGLICTSLIAHKVTPITKGERITLTYWGSGPNWR